MYANPFEGRMNRQNFIIGQLIIVLATMALGIYFLWDGLTITNLSNLIPVLIIATIPQIVITVRRLHDINLHGLFSVLILMPYISILFALFVCAKPGTTEPNEYGLPDTRNWIDSLLNKV